MSQAIASEQHQLRPRASSTRATLQQRLCRLKSADPALHRLALRVVQFAFQILPGRHSCRFLGWAQPSEVFYSTLIA